MANKPTPNAILWSIEKGGKEAFSNRCITHPYELTTEFRELENEEHLSDICASSSEWLEVAPQLQWPDRHASDGIRHRCQLYREMPRSYCSAWRICLFPKPITKFSLAMRQCPANQMNKTSRIYLLLEDGPWLLCNERWWRFPIHYIKGPVILFRNAWASLS
jgi:hypothetical protein